MKKIIKLEEKDITDAIAQVYNVNPNKVHMSITKKSVPGGEDLFIVGAEFDEEDIVPPKPPVPGPCHHGGRA